MGLHDLSLRVTRIIYYSYSCIILKYHGYDLHLNV